MFTSIVFYSISFVLVLISFFNDKLKTKKALIKAYNSFINLLPSLIAMVLFVGFLLTFISTDVISKYLGNDSGILGIIIGLITGSIAMMPSFIAFPLGATLYNSGAGYPQVAAFLGTLMAVGFSTIFLEIKFFKNKTTIYRNLLAFIGSAIFSLIIWMVM